MYNFDEIIDRRNTGSYKWDISEGELPMWVADMDFRTAPEIISCIEKRTAHGIFGYNILEDGWYDAYTDWWKRRHGWDIDREWLIFSTGVIPTISSCVRKLTSPAEKVVIMPPVYNIFYNSVVNNGRRVLECELEYNDGRYSINYQNLERCLADPETTLLIFCNPHNPAGVIWPKEDVVKVGELCNTYGVTVISDEIHCDLTYPGKEYIPFASVNETNKGISVVCIAPTKTFNIAGMQTSAVVVPNCNLRRRVIRALNTDEVAEPNTFAAIVPQAAFGYGEAWLNELREYLDINKKTVQEYIGKYIKEVSVIDSDATYLLWIDCGRITSDSYDLAKHIRKETGLYLSAGSVYGSGGEKFLRMNIATPRANVEDGLRRLKDGIGSYVSQK